MSNRITEKDLEWLLKAINARMIERDGTGAQQYQLGFAYGGCKLETKGGGRSVSHDGYGTKRQLYTFMQGFLDGLNY
jgi:hypothetical protein